MAPTPHRRPHVNNPNIVSAVRDLIPELRAAQQESDRMARPPEHIIDKLWAAGAYSLTVPKEYGGLQANMATWMEAITEIARGDAGVAWACNLVASANWTLSAYYPKHVVDEVLSQPGSAVAGVFSGRALTARPVEGGIFVEKGTWFFNSGVYQATWDLLGVPMFNEAGEPIGPGIALVPMSDVRLLDDWDTIGIRGSGSTNVSMENVFIPAERIVPLVAMVQGSVPRTFDADFARAAFSPVMVNILTYPVLGLGLHMVESFLETLPKRDIKLTLYTKAAEAPVTHLQIGEATAKVDAAQLLIGNAVREIDDWSRRKEYMPELLRAKLCRDSTYANRLIWEAVDLLALASGGSFARSNNVATRIWQDTKVGTLHAIMSPFSNFEMYGRMLAGVQPPLMLV